MTPKEALEKVPRIRPAGSIEGLREMMATIPAGAFIVEVGSYAGESTEVLAEKASQLICVDPWDPELFKSRPPGVTMNDVWLAFKVRMYPWCEVLEASGGGLHILRMTSIEAAKLVPDWAADLVYIDADHFYPSVKEDIQAWLPKVKPGGFIGGHDYDDERWRLEVNRAVDELLGKPDHVFKDCSWLKQIKGDDAACYKKLSTG